MKKVFHDWLDKIKRWEFWKKKLELIETRWPWKMSTRDQFYATVIAPPMLIYRRSRRKDRHSLEARIFLACLHSHPWALERLHLAEFFKIYHCKYTVDFAWIYFKESQVALMLNRVMKFADQFVDYQIQTKLHKYQNFRLFSIRIPSEWLF